MLSSITTVSYVMSKPLSDSIKKKEHILQEIQNQRIHNNNTPSLLKLLSTLFGLLLLIPTVFFLFIGLYCIFVMGGTFAPAGLVFCLIGLGSGILSFLFLTVAYLLPQKLAESITFHVSNRPFY